ncbi:SDR family oxidoreductase [Dolichospermum circinale]|uniref:SDR family oxidoreductase n=1 Tax=Dolichospermum circinale TaxID=109265 RepID=UPI00048208EE|nr:SDR family oxidoreductase [Dolichospermum circinale]MDB9483208.1 SDR family oxidoreductase [Dolichospermum circinale CS-537/05]MDB9455100.1 SDR family oxidoreductase [Dolichospermum circinale CS-541/06]MDB9464543.1 SDR family oxidoreductase [Dolichospermum circinale CS-541/04]MDB9476500.1 SDR family oxidoreductase [Dolichospermum circinale CS-537/11]MDB9480944.1 SDR family oxidoreductase [Dolichospermum circinale CS-537/03]
MSFEQKRRALITGASSGIGKATALAFAKAGIDIALVGRSQNNLEFVSKAAHELGVEAQAFCVDLAEVAEVKAKIQAIAHEFGNIDILINNAGIGYTENLSDTPLEDWQQVINVNLTGVFQCMMGILPGMRQQGQGTIINIASVAAKQTFPGWGAYCVSKAGLLSLSQTLAKEERANGIRVMAICPSFVNTEIWDTPTVKANFDRSQMLTPEIVAETILHTVLLPQQAVIEELTIMSNVGVL